MTKAFWLATLDSSSPEDDADIEASTNSKDLDDYMTKVKNEYYGYVHGNGSKAKVTRQDDGKHPIAGGGLEEWKVQNAKIMNNGMILAEDDRHAGYEGSDQSRASTIERGSSTGPDSHYTGKTPRTNPSHFVAINSMPAPQQCYETPPLGPSPRTDGLPGPMPGPGPSPGRPYPEPSRNGLASPSVYGSPTQTRRPLPAGGDTNAVPQDDFFNFLSEGESMRIAEALENLGGADIQGFSYGDTLEPNALFNSPLPALPFGAQS